MGTGLIFAAVVALWGAYFVPLALRRYDEAGRAASIDKFSSAMRIVAHRPAAESVEPPAAAVGDTPVVVDDEPTAPVVTRESARLAARRRRRTLLALVAATVVVSVLATIAVVPVWAVAIPVLLDIAWLVACRVQVRHERGISRPRRRAFDTASAAMSWDGSDDEETVVISGLLGEHQPLREHVMERVPLEPAELAEDVVDAIPVVTLTGGALWDPVPVTLPTYVGKPRASRTIRTIDFGEADTWTSGHVEGEDTEMPAREGASAEPQRRAVGD